MKSNVLAMLAAIAAAGAASGANAAEVAIVNGDFEANGVADGQTIPGHVRSTIGWTASGGSGTGN